MKNDKKVDKIKTKIFLKILILILVQKTLKAEMKLFFILILFEQMARAVGLCSHVKYEKCWGNISDFCLLENSNYLLPDESNLPLFVEVNTTIWVNLNLWITCRATILNLGYVSSLRGYAKRQILLMFLYLGGTSVP